MKYMKTRILAILPLCMLFIANTVRAERQPQVKESFKPLEVGEIRPEGWLKNWAEDAAKGITGKLDETGYPFSKGWADPNIPITQGSSWWAYEQAGYYSDGLIRLAYVLNDTTLIQKSQKIIEAVLARQDADGYYFIDDPKYKAKWTLNEGDRSEQWRSLVAGSHWAIATFARGVLAYYSATGDKRALDMLVKAYQKFPLFDRSKEKYPISGTELQFSRALVNLEVMLEVARYSGNEEVLSRALKVYELNESGMVQSWAKDKTFERSVICHGVTYNELGKLYAAAYPWTGRKDYLETSVNGYNYLYKHHLLPNGVNSSNEFLRGIGAFEGAETCDISDFMWSNIWLARSSGKATYGDRIERNFFNAFPAIVSPDFREHLYETAPNRIPGFNLRYRADGNYFKPLHWPLCCSGNLNRVIPNYIINMCMEDYQNRLMFLTYGPAHVLTKDGRYDFNIETEYPFRENITIHITTMPANKELLFRIPQWCKNARCTVNGKSVKTAINENGFISIRSGWKRGDKIELTFPMKAEIVEDDEQFVLFKGEEPYWGSNPSRPQYEIDGYRTGAHYATVNYGALLFALPLIDGERGFDLNEGSWKEFRFALSSKEISNVSVEMSPLKYPFRWEKRNAPLTIRIPAYLIDWETDKGNPRLPLGELQAKEKVELQLVPYGAARYRVSMFPAMKIDK